MEIDFHRARARAGAAERRRVREVLPILQAAQVRRDDGADRPLIRRAVGVAADVLENRADVQTRAAADAMERVALLGIGEEARAVIVEQDDVKFLRPVHSPGWRGPPIIEL